MKFAIFANVLGATATCAALLIAGRYASGWGTILAILAVSAILAATLNATLRLRARQERMRLRGVAMRAIHASAAERSELARALGDEAAQTLAGALLHLKAAQGSNGGDERIGDVRQAIVTTMERLEKGSAALRPSLMSLVGPEAALLSLARAACEDARFRLHARVDALGPLDAGARDALYSIAREAIANAVAHAGATELSLVTGHEGDTALLVVGDDGAGFDTRAAFRRPEGALGLSTMTELAAYWGGDVRIESRIGSGTRVEVRLPLKPAQIDA